MTPVFSAKQLDESTGPVGPLERDVAQPPTANRPVRVLLIGQMPGKRPEGVSIGFELLARSLSRSGIACSVVDLNRGGLAERAGSFSWRRASWTLIAFWQFILKMPRVNCVYLTLGCSRFGFLRDAVFIWLARLAGKRVTVHLKGGGYKEFYNGCGPTLKWLIARTLNRTDAIIVLGELLRQQFSFADPSKIRVVYNGLPIADPHCSKKSLANDRPLRVLYMSNMIRSKGVLDVLAACESLVKAGASLELRLCGAFISTTLEESTGALVGPQEFSIEIERLGLARHATYRGIVSGDRKVEQLLWADVFVLPTYYEWEGQPISIIEALAFGVPVITTRHKGIPEQISDTVNGIFVKPRCPEEIAAALGRLISDRDFYESLSAGAVRTYRSKFTQEQHLRNLISVIVAAEPSAPSVEN